MATKRQVNSFISKLSKMAVEVATERYNKGCKWSLPSVCIAQAALETGWGTSDIMVTANAYFGIKWTKGYKKYNATTHEVYDSEDVTINADFRAYDSPKESVEDYFKLICDSGIYDSATNCSDYVKTTKEIGKKYATAPSYADEVISIVKGYELYKYDTGLVDKNSDPIAIDGYWGTETTKKLQKWLGVPETGIITKQLSKYRYCNTACWTGFEWNGRVGDGGDETIKALQSKLGVDCDGYLGKVTISALQSFLGTIVDGCLTVPSLCVKALQTMLNSEV